MNETFVYDECADKDVLDMLAQIEPLKYPKDASREYLGFSPFMVTEGIIIKSHSEGDITVIDDFELTGVSIVEEKK